MNSAIWIIIVTFNAENWIEACLKSVNESAIKANIIIVDNHSTDNTVTLLKDKYSGVELITNDKNLGFGGANNLGIQNALKSGADHIVLLNQDAKLAPETIGTLVNYSKKYPEYGILAPNFCSYDGQNLDVYTLRWVLSYNLQLASDLYFDRAKEVYDVNLMPAAMWLLPKKALEDVGGFDPLFFMYGEDDDLWRRVKSRGWKTGFFPNALVYHHTRENDFSIKKRSWHLFAATVLSLKNHNRSFYKNVFFFLKSYVSNTLMSLVDLNKSELYVRQITFYKVCFCLRKIYKNRKLSYQGKMPFL